MCNKEAFTELFFLEDSRAENCRAGGGGRDSGETGEALNLKSPRFTWTTSSMKEPGRERPTDSSLSPDLNHRLHTGLTREIHKPTEIFVKIKKLLLLFKHSSWQKIHLYNHPLLHQLTVKPLHQSESFCCVPVPSSLRHSFKVRTDIDQVWGRDTERQL